MVPDALAMDVNGVAELLAGLHGGNDSDDDDTDDGTGIEDEEEVESEGGSLNDWDGRVHMVEACLPRGYEDIAARLTFAYITPAKVVGSVALFIPQALGVVALQIKVELLPSLRGAMLLRFASEQDRELVHKLSPIHHDDITLELECPQETLNRLFQEREWLANNFRGFCSLLEIDPTCLTGYDYSPLHLLIAVNHRLDIPSALWIDTEGSALGGSIAQLMPIHVWHRNGQMDTDQNLIPFFGPPPPPPHGPGNQPAGLAGLALPPPSPPNAASNGLLAVPPLHAPPHPQAPYYDAC
uniref:DUF4283 domain-containing protein n=1 Tax=Setaria italica TaxID=4555 RepID=K4AIG8_SETIT